MENLAPVICEEPIPAAPTVVKQEKQEKQVGSLVHSTLVTLPSCMALHQETKAVAHCAISEEEVSEKASFESQTWPEYKWLKEVEITVPKYFIQRKRRRMFLEGVTASTGDLGHAAIREGKASQTVFSESQTLQYKWLKEVEVTDPRKYFIQRPIIRVPNVP